MLRGTLQGVEVKHLLHVGVEWEEVDKCLRRKWKETDERRILTEGHCTLRGRWKPKGKWTWNTVADRGSDAHFKEKEKGEGASRKTWRTIDRDRRRLWRERRTARGRKGTERKGEEETKNFLKRTVIL